MNCTTTSSLTLKWNGEKLDGFTPNRGFHQGDPMSPYGPYLFILCMEMFSLLFQEKVNEGKWLPIKVSKEGPMVSHLFFVDIYLLCAQAKSNQVHLIKEVLDSFCLTFGLEVNIQKSKFNESSNIHRQRLINFTLSHVSLNLST